ncbi:MAG: SGNH/GDSL hydrolase family protein [Fulvivirga sp.]|nr:SGNH/GDSL hydrolase family protein [Fulvivirga sp.]
MKISTAFLLLFAISSIHSIAQDSLTFLALGDSYTIGEKVKPAYRWPEQLVDSLRSRGIAIHDPQIIAKTGWRTDELAAAIDKVDPPTDFDLVGLLIGVNNQYQGKSSASYRPEFRALLRTAIRHAGGEPENVFVVSIPDYGYTPFGAEKQKSISEALDEYNEINKEEAFRLGVQYFHITDISRSRDEDLVASDELHPSGQQYALWVKRILSDPGFINKLK